LKRAPGGNRRIILESMFVHILRLSGLTFYLFYVSPMPATLASRKFRTVRVPISIFATLMVAVACGGAEPTVADEGIASNEVDDSSSENWAAQKNSQWSQVIVRQREWPDSYHTYPSP